ncbi:MAG TPA: protein kinase [Gemmataceae bacterium]
MPIPSSHIADREERLDEVLAAYLKAAREGSAPTRDELRATHPDLAEELSSFFADRDQFDQLAAPLRTAVAPAPRWSPVRDLEDYELLGEIARGGMGVVFKARQRSLNRIVALKMLLCGPLAGTAALQRFRMEAEAVANLDHPHIVPIYEVDECQGQPYFSMKFMEGGTLARHSAQYGSDPKAAARLMATVAGAVHYAHQRGILHRDLKPTNILLDADGRPHVTDFGLAKRLGEDAAALPGRGGLADAKPPADDVSTAICLTLPHLLNADDHATQSGMIVGTLSYMAPEQAAGQKGTVTTAADVYGLGAILYELLTGKPPLRGETPLETLRLLRDQEPAAPSTLRANLHRDLETICLKCLNKDPRKRYPSALALVEDLNRYLQGEPIQARPVGSVERLWRWCLRKPVVAGLAAALVLTLTASLITMSVLLALALHNGHIAEANFHRAEQNLEEADLQKQEAQKNFEEAERQKRAAQKNLEEAELQRDRAERKFRQAHDAVNDFSKRAMDSRAHLPGSDAMSKLILEAALTYYQQFLDERSEDAAIQEETAEACIRVAQINSLIGSRVKSLEAYQKALELFGKLHTGDPANINWQRRLASTHHNVGTLQATNNKLKASLQSHLAARSLYEQFLRANPNDVPLQTGLAETLNNLVIAFSEMGKIDEAYGVGNQAREILEKLDRSEPGNLDVQRALAMSYNHLGVLFNRQNGHTAEALAVYEKAFAVREKLTNAQPRNLTFQRDLAESLHNLGSAQMNVGKHTEGERNWDEAHQLREKLAHDNPRVVALQCELAASYTDLGIIHSKKDESDEALKAYHKAQDILQQLLKDNPGVPQFQSDLGKSFFNIGVRYGVLKLRREAREVYEQARDIQEKLVQTNPEHLGYRTELAGTLVNLGVILGQLGRISDGRAALQHGLEVESVAFKIAPQVMEFRRTMNGLYGSLAENERAANHPAEAVAATLERAKLWPDSPTELYNAAKELGRAAALVGKGKAELIDAEKAERDKYGDLIVETLRQARAKGFKDAERMRKDRELDPVRQREDFQKLLSEWGD